MSLAMSFATPFRSLSWLIAALGFVTAVTAGEAQAFSARFSWAGIAACQAVSPAFDLSGVPAGTKKLRFTMTDLNVPSFHHGGATIAYRGGQVRKGAIHYTGPCPPGGEHHRYQWTIEALDAAGKAMATTKTTQTFPP
jgi:phosphatidylethanolamine-binding protein (PEBP) family uncharacterized protein